jgi:hypothetical protein
MRSGDRNFHDKSYRDINFDQHFGIHLRLHLDQYVDIYLHLSLDMLRYCSRTDDNCHSIRHACNCEQNHIRHSSFAHSHYYCTNESRANVKPGTDNASSDFCYNDDTRRDICVNVIGVYHSIS